MICPKCRDEFRDGIATCPDCGVELVEELLSEPPQRLLVIETTRDPDRLGVLLDQLENAQVPYVVEAGTALSMLDDESGPEPSAPDPWGARVRVSTTFAARAAEAIAETPAPASIDEPEEVETLDAADLKNPVQPR